MFSGFIFVFFPCGFDVLPVLLDEAMASWGNFCGFFYNSLLIVSKLWDVCLFWSVAPFFTKKNPISFVSLFLSVLVSALR
jgi:hypothetical protein